MCVLCFAIFNRGLQGCDTIRSLDRMHLDRLCLDQSTPEGCIPGPRLRGCREAFFSSQCNLQSKSEKFDIDTIEIHAFNIDM